MTEYLQYNAPVVLTFFFISFFVDEVAIKIDFYIYQANFKQGIIMRDQFESPLIKRYASKEMSFIFSPQYKFQTWRKLWIFLAESEKELGLPITPEQIDELKAHATDINFDVAEAEEKRRRVG